jgi:5-formyltetrahydrofolate cyclo-ligase
LRAHRRRLPQWARQRAARRMAAIVRRQRWYQQARTLALYFANDGEIDPLPLLKRARAAGKRIFLPRLRGRRLEFVAQGMGAPLRRNRLDILEPIGSAIALRKLDVVCMPLVGFDRGGRRLGMGGGFYDRTFAGKVAANALKMRRPLLIGLAYAFQQAVQLPRERWDVPLAGVVTERAWIRANR